jgi:polyphenol oxidase
MTEVPYFLDRLRGVCGVRAGFVERVAGVAVEGEKEEVLGRLAGAHGMAVERLGFGRGDLWLAEQVHGGEVAVVGGGAGRVVPGVDGLVSGRMGVVLGIHVADCGAVFVVDGRNGAIGLAHSGKKGTEANIVGETVRVMGEQFGSRPEDLLVALGPCIRPPAYEVDFAAEIGCQVVAAGVPARQFFDSGECTSGDLGRFYSYRLEKGRTGRMLALLGRVGV